MSFLQLRSLFRLKQKRYWVGGTGNWSDTAHWSANSGGAGGAAVPDQYTDVVFDAYSFTAGSQTVSLTANSYCKSMNWTGVTNSPAFALSSYILYVYGSLTFSASMSVTGSNQFWFAASSGTHSMDFAGLSFTGMTLRFDGGATWIVTGNVAACSSFYLWNGTVTLQGSVAITTSGYFAATGASLNTYNFNNATITCDSFSMTGASNLTINAGTSSIIVVGTGGTNQEVAVPANTVLYDVTMQNNASNVTGNSITFHNFTKTTGAGTKVAKVIFPNGVTTTITGTFTVTGNNQTERIRVGVQSGGSETWYPGGSGQAAISAAAVSLSYVDFHAIYALGAAAPFTGTSIGDLTGNTDVTTTTPVTRYWVGNGGSWSDYTNHWASATNGSPGATYPLAQDTVVFDASSITSGSQTITIDEPVGNFNFNGVTNSPSVTLSITVYAFKNYNLTGVASISDTSRGVYLISRTGTFYLSTGTVTSAAYYYPIIHSGGTISLSGNFSTSAFLQITGAGTFTANTYNVTIAQFLTGSFSGGTINMGSGTWTLMMSVAFGTTWDPGATNTLNAQTSTIVLMPIASSATFAGQSKTYNNLTVITDQNPTISGSNTFNTFTVARGSTFKFTAGTTQTVTSFVANGDAGETYYFDASDSGPTDINTQWTDDANAFDGSTSTSATTLSTSASDYLEAYGTNAPGSGGDISSVNVRVYVNGNTDRSTVQISTAGYAQQLATFNVTTDSGWSPYTNLTTPTGGWTWAKVQALGARAYYGGGTVDSGVRIISRIEILIVGTSTIASTSAGSSATLSKASGTVICDYLSLQDSTATGGAEWYAGKNSTSVSGNTGWQFQDNTTQTVTAKAKIGVPVTTYTVTVTAKARIKSSGTTVTVTAKARIKNTLTIGGLTGIICDTYSETNQNTNNILASDARIICGQSITGDGGILDFVKFYLQKVSTPTGNAYAKIYTHSGTFGTSSTAQGSTLLATSDAFDVSTISSVAYDKYTITFSGANKIALTNGTYYCLTLEFSADGGPRYIKYALDDSTPTHAGNHFSYNGASWFTYSGSDSIFDVYTIKTVDAKARIKQAAVTKTVTAKARIKSSGVTKTVTAKARIKTASITQTITARARIKVAGVTKTVTSKARIKNTSVATVTSKARVKNTTTQTVTSKTRIKSSGNTVTIQAKARIKQTAITKTVTAKAAIRGNRYWVGNGGNWSDGTNHWSTSSGGSPGASVPTSLYNAVFDANSFSSTSQTVTIDTPTRVCSSLIMTNVTNSPTLDTAVTVEIYGSVDIPSTVTVSSSGGGYFSFRGAQNRIIDIRTTSFAANVTFSEVDNTGTSNLQNNWTTTGYWFLFQKGTFNTNGYTITTNRFSLNGSTQTRVLNLGSSTIKVNSLFELNGSNYTLNEGTSTIEFNSYGAELRGNADTFYNLLLSNTGTVKASNTFNQITISPASQLTLEAGTTQTISDLVALGTIFNRVYIYSTATATLSKSSGTINANWAVIQNNTATGGATFNAYNSTNNGGNSGWNFISAPNDLYWVGGGGNWSDSTNHWATSSNGAPSVFNYPADNTIVHIDSSSGFSSGGTINLDNNASFKDIISNSGHTYTISTSSGSGLNCLGSVTFETGMTVSVDLSLNAITAGHTLTMSGVVVNNLWITGGTSGGWTLQDNLTTTGEFYLENGAFDANDHNITANDFYFYADTGYTPTVTMGTETWEATGQNDVWVIDEYSGQVVTVNCETSTIKITDTNGGAGKNFYGNYSTPAGTGKTYNNVWFSGEGTFRIYGSNTFNDFKCTPASAAYALFYPASTQTVTTFTVSGTAGNLIYLDTTSGSGQFSLSKTTGTVNRDYLDISNSNAAGGALWYAGAHSANTINNTGWIFLEEYTVTAKARIKSSGVTNTITSKARIKATQTKTVTAKAKIVNTISQTVTAKARIKHVNVTKTVTAKSRIKSSGTAQTITAKARIKQLDVTKTVTAKARIKYVDVTKTVTAKARIKQANITKTIDAKARIKQAAVTKTIQAKARVKNTTTQTVTAKTRIRSTGVTKTVTAKARIKVVNVTQTVTAKAKIAAALVTYTVTVTTKARIKVVTAQTVTAKARIKITSAAIVTAKARIKNTTTQTATAKARIRSTGVSKTIDAKARVKAAQTKTVTAKARIKIAANTVTVTAKANIVINFRDPGIETDIIPWYAGKSASDIGSVWALHDASLVAGNDGDGIGTLSDTSGNSRDVTQSNAGNKPTKKTNIQNGKSILRFDANDVLYETASGALNGDKTLILIADVTDTGGYKTMFGLGTDGGGYHIWSLSPSEQFWVNTAGAPNQITDGYATGGFDAYLAYNSGTTFNISVNSGTEASGAHGSANEEAGHIVGDYYYVGGYQPSMMDFAELTIFSKNLSNQEKNDILSHLGIKWALTLGSTYGANVTRNTATKRSGAASIKIVTTGYDTALYQFIYPKEARYYTITAYAYTDGSAVTSSDVEVLYDGAAVSTTITSDTGGWYKIESIVYVDGASEKKFGILAKANKTVYLDDFNLAYGPWSRTVTAKARLAQLNVTKTVTAKARIKVTSTATVTAKANITSALSVYTQTVTAKARIKNTVTQTVTAKARIKSTGVTQTISSKARIKYVDVTSTIDAKARIKHVNTTKTITAKARIKYVDVTKTTTAKAKIKQASITNTITAKARIKNTTTQTIQAKAEIKAAISQTVDAKARIRSTGVIVTVTSKARIKQLDITKTIQAKARIKHVAITNTVSAKARIKHSAITNTIAAKARIKSVIAQTIAVKARIKSTGIVTTITAKAKINTVVTNTVTAKARIKKAIAATISAKAKVVNSYTASVVAKARIAFGTVSGHGIFHGTKLGPRLNDVDDKNLMWNKNVQIVFINSPSMFGQSEMIILSPTSPAKGKVFGVKLDE